MYSLIRLRTIDTTEMTGLSMSDDIVTRLRNTGLWLSNIGFEHGSLMSDAADEIERLRKEEAETFVLYRKTIAEADDLIAENEKLKTDLQWLENIEATVIEVLEDRRLRIVHTGSEFQKVSYLVFEANVIKHNSLIDEIETLQKELLESRSEVQRLQTMVKY